MRTYDPEHISSIIHAYVDDLAYKFARQNGYLDRLKGSIADDRFMSPDSLPARQLRTDAEILRRLAEAIEACREGFIENTTARLIES